MTLITPDTISFSARVTEDELRKRMADEVLQSIGALDDAGKPLPGVKATVRRGTGRTGGYEIIVSGPTPVQIGRRLEWKDGQ